ncbi:MAG: DUF2947 domain-containing protein [Pseudomonadales bacterium]|nr:DUF2947 domain-containing protein [Pseudomonadales bacterium]NRA17637.1 DUF2947 domain-containing protein [Oceanospirillaceae bacterium]
MEYISLDKYRYAWFFKHKELPISEANLQLIKPLAESSSAQIWHQLISQNANHPDLFQAEDWPHKKSSWSGKAQWQAQWDSEEQQLPDQIENFIDWEGNTVVYFCYNADNLIETTWEIFCQHWKNFLFLDNGPILIGKRRREVIQFHQDGYFSIGCK